MTLYELNQIQYANLSTHDNEQIIQDIGIIYDYLATQWSKYYMLLSNENRYYTVFHQEVGEATGDAAHEIMDIILELGEVKSVEITEDEDAIEIWIKHPDKETCDVYYLFDYQNGVVEI